MEESPSATLKFTDMGYEDMRRVSYSDSVFTVMTLSPLKAGGSRISLHREALPFGLEWHGLGCGNGYGRLTRRAALLGASLTELRRVSCRRNYKPGRARKRGEDLGPQQRPGAKIAGRRAIRPVGLGRHDLPSRA
jgi:hypothetical protein